MKIEHGIPIPPSSTGRAGSIRDMVSGMGPTDSLLCETEGRANTVRKWIYSNGWKAATRKTRDGWRVWRTE